MKLWKRVQKSMYKGLEKDMEQGVKQGHDELISVLCKKWGVTREEVIHYLTTDGVEIPQRKEESDGVRS